MPAIKPERTVWSVVALEANGHGRGKLIGHAEAHDALTLTDAVPYVDASAARRVATGNREVCAWIIGNLPDGRRVGVYRNLSKSTKVQAPSPTDYVTYDRARMLMTTKRDGAVWAGAASVTFTDRARAL